LIGAEQAHGVHLLAIVEADEVHAFMVEAVPPRAQRTFAEALTISCAVVGCDVVFAGNIKRFAGSDSLDELLRGVELRRFGGVRNVAGMQQRSGVAGSRLILSSASFSVPLTS